MTPDKLDLVARFRKMLWQRAEAVHRRPRRRRIRVLHVIRPGRGRPARQLKLLLKHLDGERFESAVVASPLEEPASPGELREWATDLHVLDMHPSFTPEEDLPAIGRIMKVLRRGRFDVLHVHGWKAALLGRPAGRAASVAAIVYTPHEFRFERARTVRARRWHARLERLLGCLTDAMVCASGTEAETARRMKLVRPERIHIVPDGVDFGDIPRRSRAAGVRKSLQLSAATRLIVMIGRLDAPKDPGTVLRAARHVLRVLPQTSFVLVGDGEMIDYCRGLSHQLGIDQSVICTGYRADAIHVAAAAAVNVVSAQEGGPTLSLLENMALGRPVVASDLPGFREIVTHGKTGVLFPVGDEHILAGAILKLVGDKPIAERLGKAARAYVKEHHAADDWADAVEAVYLKTLAESAKKR